jgi:hypothetical protein
MVNLNLDGAASTGSQMQNILHVYHADSNKHSNHEFAPFLNGYIGEHVAFYRPGAKQLAGFPHQFPDRT